MFKKKRTFFLSSTWSSVFLFFVLFALVFSSFLVVAAPTGPTLAIQSNETKPVSVVPSINVSGGYISTINLSAEAQNTRWKGMLGQVTGSFTLDDASGSTLFDWSLSSISGEIYATRNVSTPSWNNAKCANISTIERENLLMNHTSSDDNITRTFNDTSHGAFTVGTASISSNSCFTLNTYIGNATQDTRFEETVLTDSSNLTIVYSTIIENNINGFDSLPYDFQMIVPDNGLSTFTGATPYYLYVELT